MILNAEEMNRDFADDDAANTVDLRPDKALGQHFLRDKNIIENIIKAIQPQDNEVIVEIGPGPGAMTVPLLAAGARVIAIEKDARFASVLQASASSRGGDLTFELQDALKVDWLITVPVGAKVVGNLPYNVGTQIVLNILQQRAQTGAMTFMLQKEVVERFLAPPSTSARGRISVWRELYADGSRLFDVPRNAFNPPPNVTSAMMQITPLAKPRYDVDEKKLKLVLDTTFNQRRKMLRASLKSMLTVDEISMAGIDPTVRPETLTTEEFCLLANAI